MSFKKRKIGDIATVQTGPFGSQLHQSDYKEVGTPIITVEHLGSNRILHENLPLISDDDKSRLVKYSLREGDIVFSKVNSVDRRAYVRKNESGWLFSGRCLRVRVNDDQLDPMFLSYYFGLETFKEYIRGIAVGATMPSLNTKILSEVEIIFPPLPHQRAIASTLSALDDKIELNNRINKTLEEMAQALFKQWFVDFEFPDENGQPYKSSGGEMAESELGLIPKGWKVSGLGEIIETVNGFSYKGSDIKESVNAMMTIKNFNRNGGLNAVGFKEIEISERVKDKHHVDLFDVVVACTDITQKADIIGNPVLVLTKGKYRKIVISMDLVKVIVKHPFISSCLIYMFLKDIRFKQQALGYTSGTTVLHLNKMVFSDYPVIIPEDEKLLEKMSFIIEPIFHLIGMTIDNSQNLTSLRDSLLPKLMSGEIRVSIEEVTADV